MPHSSGDNVLLGRRYALCVGIGTYTNLRNRNLRFAVADARAMKERLESSLPDSFEVKLLIEPAQTSKAALNEAVEHLLSAPDRQAEDLAVLYFSCHGDLSIPEETFCLLSSDAVAQPSGGFDPTTCIGISDLARWFSQAKLHNIVMLLDVCHSGGAGLAVQHFPLKLSVGPNFFIIGGARQDQVTRQSSQLGHGMFTHCLLRAFKQPPAKEGWLTISQIHTFVSEEINWFAKDHPIQIQGVSISVNPNLPLVRNPDYPELCPLPPLWNVPFQRNDFFTGQENILTQLASRLQSVQKTSVQKTILTQPQAIIGLGGIGKTQLALEYAYRHRQDYHAVLWGRADTREALISTFMDIASLLELPEKDEQDRMVIVEAVKHWLAYRSKWLFILDNADDLALVKEFIPQAFQGHLLLTTRAQVMGGLARKIEVETMRPETGALLLLRRAGLLTPDPDDPHPNDLLGQAAPADVTIAKVLSVEMGGLPLALDQAGAYIEEVSCSLQDYHQLYQTRRAELLRERGGVKPDYPESVATTWSLAFQKVEKDNPAASDLLRLCAFLYPDAIPEEIITKGAEYLGPRLQVTASDPLALDKAITALRAYSLLRRDGTTRTLTIHRLVQAVLKDDMDEPTAKYWGERVVRAVKAALPEIKYENWPAWERLIGQAQTCAERIQQDGSHYMEAALLLLETGWYLRARVRYQEAEPLLVRALQISEQEQGKEHPATARYTLALASLYQYQGKYEQAESLFKQVLAVLEQHQDPEYLLDWIGAINNLTGLYTQQGKYEQAELLQKHYELAGLKAFVVPISEALSGSEALSDSEEMRPALLRKTNLFNNLAELYRAQGQYEQAEPLLQRAMKIREHLLGPDHPDVATVLNNLANCYMKLGKYEEAEELHKRALVICERSLGPDHPNTAMSLHNLAVCYMDQGNEKDGQAEKLLQQARAIQEQTLGLDHLGTAYTLYDLAQLYAREGKDGQAEPLFQQALAIQERHMWPESPDVTRSRDSLALLYMSQGKHMQLESLYERAVTSSERQTGSHHTDPVIKRHNLAEFYFIQGKYAEAESLFQPALAILEQQIGPEHFNAAQELSHLADLYVRQGKHEQAESLHKRIQSTFQQQLGSEHPTMIVIHHNLADFYARQGKHEEAESLYRRILDIFKRHLGFQQLDTIISLYILANFFYQSREEERAESLRERALIICKQQLGPEDLDTAQSLNSLMELYFGHVEYGQAEPLFEAKPLYKRALDICEQQLGPEQTHTAKSLHNLVERYMSGRKRKRLKLLCELCECVLDISEQQLGLEHPFTLRSLKDLALVYIGREKYEQAEPLLQRLLNIYEQQMEPQNIEIAGILHNLAEVYRAEGKYTEAEPLYQRAIVISEQQLGPEHSLTQTTQKQYATLLRAVRRRDRSGWKRVLDLFSR
jgi:tetratricopeptide (TPR) repeat protein